MKHLKKDPMYIFLIVLTVSVSIGLETWHTLFNNFAVEIAGLKGHHIGVIQSVREIPGFLTLLVVFVILIISEHRLAALSIFPWQFEPISRRSEIPGISHPAWRWALPSVTLPLFFCRPSAAFYGLWIIGFRFSEEL